MGQDRLGLKEVRGMDFSLVTVSLNHPESMEYLFRNEKPDVIALGVFQTDLIDRAKLCQQLRERWPNVKIIVGGPLATVMPKTVLSETGADILCRGEADFTFREVMERLIAGKNVLGIEGVMIRGEDSTITEVAQSHRIPRVPLSQLNKMEINPDMLQVALGEGDFQLVPVSLSRGCAYGDCSFCSIDNNRWRRLGAQEARKRLDVLAGLGKFIAVWDPLFGGQPQVLDRYLAAFTGFTGKLGVSMSVDQFLLPGEIGKRNINFKLIKKLAKIGVERIALGVESFSDSMLLRIKNGRYTGQEAVNVLLAISRAGITVRPTIILFDIDTTSAELDDCMQKLFGYVDVAAAEKFNVQLHFNPHVICSAGTPYYDYVLRRAANGLGIFGLPGHPADLYPYWSLEPEHSIISQVERFILRFSDEFKIPNPKDGSNHFPNNNLITTFAEILRITTNAELTPTKSEPADA
jgi:hypothetical protein